VFIKTLAEDSVSCKSYVVIALCANPAKAKVMWGWNGRSKITLVGEGRQKVYKWTELEIDQWIENYIKHHPESCLTVNAILIEFKTAALRCFIDYSREPFWNISQKRLRN
jgi:hypothetical protein